MHEAAAAIKAIKSALAADTGTNGFNTLVAGRIYAFEAPQEATLPYGIIKQVSPGMDTQGIGTKRQLTSPLYGVFIVVADNPTSTVAQQAAKRIDEVVGKLVTRSVTDANGDAYQVSARREGGALILGEHDKVTNKVYYQVGGRYRVRLSAV